MSDLTLICADCTNEFVFSAGEQDFYRAKGLKPPRFCPICRGKYKAASADRAQYQKPPHQ
jgi:hypothetical protein